MNKKLKKIMMIGLLVAFIAIITVAIIMVNNKSKEKVNTNTDSNVASNKTASNNTSNINETSNEEDINSGIIRRTTKNVTADTSNMVEIGDSYFIQATYDVYYNLDSYIGKTIKMEGLIYSYEDSNGDICYAVVRNTPGCCGSDGLAGLDIRYDGEYPEDETWVTVIGVIDTDKVYGDTIPAIQVTSLEKTEQGKTFVSN